MNERLKEFVDIYAPDGILHLASRERKETMAKLLAVPFDAELHYPMAYIHLHYAMLDEAEAILAHTEDKEDETYKQLEDYLNALKEARRADCGVFPLTVRYRDWWNGPHLPFPKEFSGKSLDSWFPVRLDYVSGEHAFLTVAKLEHGEVVYGCQVDVPAILVGGQPDDMGEIAFYGDSYLIQFYTDKVWDQEPELRAVRDKVWPTIQRSHECLREEIEKDIERMQ